MQSRSLLGRNFYFFMSLLIAAVVVFGFSFTVERKLFHPAVQPPFILYIHAAFFAGWVIFFILQTGLVRMRNIRWHQLMGYFGATMGGSMVVLGIATAIIMTRFDTVQLHQPDAVPFLIVPLFDMLCFATMLGLAVYWRRVPEYHRRLMLVATCVLTNAAFGRLGPHLFSLNDAWGFAGVDLLIILAVARDLLVTRRVHSVYLYALPVFVVGQTVVAYTYLNRLPYWMNVAQIITG